MQMAMIINTRTVPRGAYLKAPGTMINNFYQKHHESPLNITTILTQIVTYLSYIHLARQGYQKQYLRPTAI